MTVFSRRPAREACPASLLAIAALSIFASTVAVSAYAEEADEGRGLLDNFVKNVQSMTASFEQSLVDADNIVLESSRGTVQIRRPGQFRWSYDEPYVQILVADGLNIWSYDVDLEQVTVKAQADVLANTPALLLGGTRGVLEEFEYIESFKDKDTVWVRLRPKNTENGFSQVELGFDQGVLQRMIFTDNLEQTTLIALLDVGLNETLDDSFFEFTMPDDADLVGEPIVADRSGM